MPRKKSLTYSAFSKSTPRFIRISSIQDVAAAKFAIKLMALATPEIHHFVKSFIFVLFYVVYNACH